MSVNERLNGNLTVGGTITQGGNNVQNALTLTTTGTSGAATLVGSTLNVPQYGGGGASGINTILQLQVGDSTSASITAAGLTTSALAANRLYAYQYTPNQTFTCSSLYINCVTAVASALGRILIYSNVSGLPSAKLYESSNLDLSTTGIKTATTSFTFTAGTTYWLSYHSSSTPTIQSIVSSAVIPIKISGLTLYTTYFQNVTFGSAPTPFGSLTPTNISPIYIGITL